MKAVCLDCGFSAAYELTAPGCPRCGCAWREARYDLASALASWSSCLSRRPFDLWRYRELLPIPSFRPGFSIGEGGTPLLPAPNLGMMLGIQNLFIKDERQSPTQSFKDRQAAVGVAALKDAGITEAVLASTGNVAIAYSAYAARAGIKLWAFLTSLVPAEKMREVAIYGTQVVKITATYDQAKELAAEFARQRGLYLESGARSIPSVEAMKTIAYEIAEQLGMIQDSGDSLIGKSPGNLGEFPKWKAPDWYIQAVSGGLGPLGVLKGFYELKEMGLTDHIPALGGLQAEGCAPMVHAWQNNLPEAQPVSSPLTHITTLSTGNPGRTYSLLRQKMLAGGGGEFESVSDADSFRAMHILAKMEGISAEPAAAVAIAGLIKLARNGVIKPSDVVVVNCTGHTLAVESDILGDGWARDLQAPAGSQTKTPREGFLTALRTMSAQRFPKVLIVDDTAESRCLIRRILQSQGDYTVYEAPDGYIALEVARQARPDLIILDLIMPELDGFAVLDALKAEENTAAVPVIVVTGKELTCEEREWLDGRIYGLMRKGEFMSDELADEIKASIYER